MIKRGIFCVIIAMAITFSGFSDDIIIKGEAPTFKPTDPNDPLTTAVIDDFNEFIEDAFKDIVGSLQGTVDGLLPSGSINTTGLLTGFGTASIFSSHGATMWAYSDYKFLSISLGSLVGLKLPGGMINELANGKTNFDKLLENLDLGINPQFFQIHVGINPSAKFEVMPKKLSFGIRLGFFGLPKLDIPFQEQNMTADMNFTTFTIGLTANYQFFPSNELVEGLITWRGLSVGSGFIFQTTNLDITMPFAPVTSPNAFYDPTGQLSNISLELDPKVKFKLGINTFTIPVEVSTAIKLLIFNIPFGIGFDLGFGSSEISATADSSVKSVGGNNSLVQPDKNGSLSVSIGNNNIPPNVFNFKIMTGFGFTFGDVFIIDIPFTYYLTDGFNLGFTLGLRF